MCPWLCVLLPRAAHFSVYAAIALGQVQLEFPLCMDLRRDSLAEETSAFSREC